MSKKAESQARTLFDTPVKADLLEGFPLGHALAEANVDRGTLTIRNVKLCGRLSLNGRTYSDTALSNAARLYEGAPFYLDHPTERDLRERQGIRSVQDLAGQVRNSRKAGDSVYGEIHLLDREPTKSLVLALAEQMPKLAGASHRAQGTIRKGDDGNDVVETIDAVAAVELVTDPATTAGFFESVTREQETDMKDVTIEKLKAERPDLVEAVLADSKQSTELEDLKKEHKALQEAEAKRQRAEAIEKKLKAAELPETLVTDPFKAQLAEAKDDAAVDALIEDRKAIAAGVTIASTPARPRSVEREVTIVTGGAKVTPFEESKLGDIHDRLLV